MPCQLYLTTLVGFRIRHIQLSYYISTFCKGKYTFMLGFLLKILIAVLSHASKRRTIGNFDKDTNACNPCFQHDNNTS